MATGARASKKAKGRGLFGALTAREQIGAPRRRYTLRMSAQLWQMFPTIDINQVDYAFWDKARRGQARGLELSGLLIKPIVSKIGSMVLGKPVRADVSMDDNPDEATLTRIDSLTSATNRWLVEHHDAINLAYEDSLALGDAFIVFNGDASLTLVPANVVDPIVDESDLSKWIGWRITERHDHPLKPGESQTIIDEYYADRRERTILRNGATVAQTQVFRNPLGIIPVVHVRNRLGSDERFGRPELAGAVNLLQRYGAVLDAGITGNLRQGRPLPVIEKMGDPATVKDFWDTYGKTQMQTNPETGESEPYTYIEFDPDQLLTLPGEATFAYRSPSPFADETTKLLGVLFWLLIQHSETPEYAMGTAIESSKASAETQTPPLDRFVEKKRTRAGEWLLHLARLAMTYQAILTNNVKLLPMLRAALEWAPLSDEDKALVLQAIDFAKREGLIDDLTALEKLPLDIRNPEQVLDKARQEAQDGQDAFDAAAQAAINRLASQPDPADNAENQPGDVQQDAAA